MSSTGPPFGSSFTGAAHQLPRAGRSASCLSAAQHVAFRLRCDTLSSPIATQQGQRSAARQTVCLRTVGCRATVAVAIVHGAPGCCVILPTGVLTPVAAQPVTSRSDDAAAAPVTGACRAALIANFVMCARMHAPSTSASPEVLPPSRNLLCSLHTEPGHAHSPGGTASAHKKELKLCREVHADDAIVVADSCVRLAEAVAVAVGERPSLGNYPVQHARQGLVVIPASD